VNFSIVFKVILSSDLKTMEAESTQNQNAASAQVHENATTDNNNNNDSKKTQSGNTPIVCLVIGMAGSGKTTLMQRLNSYLLSTKQPCYIVNLDPAVKNIPYTPNIDIRDTVKYKEVMKQYNLGPNGAIVTSLNLFSTKFDQVLSIVDKRAPENKYILFDTPGQIEVFTWSASGNIITETLASTYPTVVVYVVDTPKTISPTTFMSNMLYACSILYKTRLPLVLAFNKVDIMSHEFAVQWMTDFDALQAAIRNDESYMSDLTTSMGLVLEEFYNNLKCVGVSAVTGKGMPEFFKAIDEAAVEYHTDYKQAIQKQIAEKKRREERKKQKEIEKFKNDYAQTKGMKVVLDASKQSPVSPLRADANEESEEESEYEALSEEDDDEINEDMEELKIQK